jgi:hypothetical protein
MKAFGFTLAVIGSLIALGSLFLSISVPTEINATELFGASHTSEVYNLGKLQTQLLVFIGGCAIAVIGMILGSAGLILERVARSDAISALATPDVRAVAVPIENSFDLPTTPNLSDGKQGRIDIAIGIGFSALSLIIFFAIAYAFATNGDRNGRAAIIENTDAIADGNAAMIDDLGEKAEAK